MYVCRIYNDKFSRSKKECFISKTAGERGSDGLVMEFTGKFKHSKWRPPPSLKIEGLVKYIFHTSPFPQMEYNDRGPRFLTVA